MFEGSDVVDTLADEGALVEEVLVEVRDDTRVGIDPGGARGEAAESRPLRARQTHRDSRLDDAVSDRNAGECGMGHGTVEDVRHRSHHLAGCVAGQVGVGVERDHEPHLGKEVCLAGHVGEMASRTADFRAADDGIQVGELPSLAFTPHPDTFACVPCAAAVQQQEVIVAIRRIPTIERFDPCSHLPEQRVVDGQRFRRGIGEVGEQGEMQVRIAVGEVADFQALEQAIDRDRIGEQRGHGDERAVFRWDALLEIEPGQGMWPNNECRRPGDQPHGQMHGHQQHWHGEEPPPAGGSGSLQEQNHTDCGQHSDRGQQQAERAVLRHRDARPPWGEPGGHPHETTAKLVHEAVAACVDQPVANVGFAGGRSLGADRTRLMCECHGPLRDLLFASASPPRDPLDAGAVAVAGGEVHPGIHVGRIITERLFHDAVAGDEVAPIVDREKPQAADAVADRHLIGGVRLAFGQHQLLDREALPSEAMLEPRAGQREGWRVALQCPCELREEGTR